MQDIDPQLLKALIIFSAFVGTALLGLVAAIWKAFQFLSAIEKRLERQIGELNLQIIDNRHKHDLKAQQIEALNDRLVLAINGVEELVKHVRTRTLNDSDKLKARVDQLENYLTKTTSYESRD